MEGCGGTCRFFFPEADSGISGLGAILKRDYSGFFDESENRTQLDRASIRAHIQTEINKIDEWFWDIAYHNADGVSANAAIEYRRLHTLGVIEFYDELHHMGRHSRKYAKT